MKAVSFLLLCFLVLINFSCTKESPGVNNSDSGTLKSVTPNTLPINNPYPSFGVFPLNGDVSRITNSGPSGSGSGWRGIILPLTVNDPADLNAAISASYFYIFGQIDRDSIVNSKWSYVQSQITFGKNHGCNYFYIDDGKEGGGISQSQIDYVATLVHQYANCKLATATYDSATIHDYYNTWYSNIDIIFPYNYYKTISQLQSFFQFVKTQFPSKTIVPFLGYYADISRSNPYAYQTAGFIEMAKSFATWNIVFYYHHWNGGSDDISQFNALTTYLQDNYNMGNGLQP